MSSNSIRLNETTPWTTDQPQVPAKILKTPGEIVLKERLLYFWLARKLYQGLGAIVEIGALLGASSTALGMGLLYNQRVEEKDNRIHVYDKFEAYDHLVDNLFPAYNITGISVGEDFSHVYRENTKPLSAMININAGDILDAEWNGAPIEILFVDCSTDAETGNAIIEKFYPYLIPGKSLVIDQDFFFQRCWWFAYKAELLADVLKPKYAEDCTLVSDCSGDVGDILPNLSLTAATYSHRIEVMEKFRSRLQPAFQQLVTLQLAWMLADNGDLGLAETQLATVLANPLSDQARWRGAMTQNHIATSNIA